MLGSIQGQILALKILFQVTLMKTKCIIKKVKILTKLEQNPLNSLEKNPTAVLGQIAQRKDHGCTIQGLLQLDFKLQQLSLQACGNKSEKPTFQRSFSTMNLR